MPLGYRHNPNALSFEKFMNTEHLGVLHTLALFCKMTVQHFDEIHK